MQEKPTVEQRERVEKFIRQEFGGTGPISDEDVMAWIKYWKGLAAAIKNA